MWRWVLRGRSACEVMDLAIEDDVIVVHGDDRRLPLGIGDRLYWHCADCD